MKPEKILEFVSLRYLDKSILSDADSSTRCGSGQEIHLPESATISELVIHWRDMPASEMRLRCGEMTAQEIRTVRAVLNQIISANAEL